MSPDEINKIGADEDARWKTTHKAVVDHLKTTSLEYDADRKLARELTSQIVAETRDEEKAALASDEAVAHGLTKLRLEKSGGLEELVKQPYFARVVTDEGDREVEFRLGTASFPDQRIVDWRKAPISKLYYDYKEGAEFCVTIQGREREGFIKLRRSYEGVRDRLGSIETARGRITRTANGWEASQDGGFSRGEGHDGHLPPILSLITPDQFELITQDAVSPIVIQGIAGSGKTTVALHRLAWLLHEDNSDARPEKCLVVMLNRSLKAYVELTLPELQITGVPIRTYYQWAHRLTDAVAGPRARPPETLPRVVEVERFKSSSLMLALLEAFAGLPARKPTGEAVEDLFQFYEFCLGPACPQKIPPAVKERLAYQLKNRFVEFQDDTLLLLLVYLDNGYYPVTDRKVLGVVDHLVIDEAQDFGVTEIRALLNALDENRTVTIVGDAAQKIVTGREFISWEALLHDAGFAKATPVSLTVSHRSTHEIMRIASTVRGENIESTAGGRHGPEPIFIKADNPTVVPHLVGNWITARLAENSRTLCGIICRTPREAQELVNTLRALSYSSVRLGHRDQFDFSPGITVTSVHQVKGLEFRNVLVVEPSARHYPLDDPEGRHLLYVAVTRAESRLDFVGHEKPTPLLPALKKASGKDVLEDVRKEIIKKS